jgi:anti-sigma regulatory factor (Ser/Thr protein kinase)
MKHDLLVYDDMETLVSEVAPFLQAGLAEGEVVIAVLAGPAKREALEDALGADARHVAFVESAWRYQRPATTLAGYDATLRRHLRDGAPAVRVFGELPADEGPQWRRDWAGYDALLNRAFADRPVWIFCGFDRREQPAFLVDAALHTHERVCDGSWRDAPDYREPEDVLLGLAVEADPLPDLPPLLPDGEPAVFRHRLRGAMAAAGVPEARVPDLLVAATELHANAVRHGGGVAGARAGRVGEHFVIEVADGGPGLDDPMAGYLPPRPEHADGSGLWVARQCADRVELVSAPTGLTARLWA